MFLKIGHTEFPPKGKPVLIWDGNCGFCKYWVTRWQHIAGDQISFRTFQDAASSFKDIPLKEFKKASRLIEPSGSIYSGPDSAYRLYDYSSNHDYPYHNWYAKKVLFMKLSDHGYNWIAKHRPFMFRLTKILFGTDPLSLKYYWLFYILALMIVFYLIGKNI
ncbi:MAG: DCC1-like thiol-disulfide oxidoreductase family protein [Leeuwenhoekiella sp.]